MMMVMMSMARFDRNMALSFMAMLPGRFQLQSGMADAMLSQFLPDGILDFVRVAVGDHMHGRIVTNAVHTPQVDPYLGKRGLRSNLER